MPELFIELFSEEIPARLQRPAAEDLSRRLAAALADLHPTDLRPFHGPRRIAIAVEIDAGTAASTATERGPRLNAPLQAMAGFLRKHNVFADALRQEGDFWVLDQASGATPAEALVARVLPDLLRRFPWPKSMRWGGTSAFQWIRPLRRIICLLDGAIVKFDLAQGDDDGHGLAAGDLTEGHRVHAPGPVAVQCCADWQETLRQHYVLVSAAERQQLIADGIAAAARRHGLAVVEDAGLVEEVAGLVEWPIPLLGRIDAAFMDLPPEVMQVSMRVNQRYFALRQPGGAPAPWFAFAANIEAPDGGTAIIAGNERVLRARFSDARHFWDLDRKTALAQRVAALDGITFHADLGSQGDRVRRIAALARYIAPRVGADPALAVHAARLAKADLTTGMVGEFPELQGVMGAYYARHDGEPEEICAAIRQHYLPKGLADELPRAPVAIAVALADKLDQLAGFFAIGQKPTGSGDPFALRRAALGVIRILREHGLRLGLRDLLLHAAGGLGAKAAAPALLVSELLGFVADRLRVQLRAEGARYDVLAAVFAAGDDDDLVRVLARAAAVETFLATEDGSRLLGAYRRAANILRIEDRKDGPHGGPVDESLLEQPEEQALHHALARTDTASLVAAERFGEAMALFATLRAPLDDFFERITVNAEIAPLRRNRLRLLTALKSNLSEVADFRMIEN